MFVQGANKLVASKQQFLRKKKRKLFFIRGQYNTLQRDGTSLRFNHNGTATLKRRLYIAGSATVGPILFKIQRRKALSSFVVKL